MTKNTTSLYGTKSPDKIVKLLKSNRELKESFEQLFSQKKNEQIKIFDYQEINKHSH